MLVGPSVVGRADTKDDCWARSISAGTVKIGDRVVTMSRRRATRDVVPNYALILT